MYMIKNENELKKMRLAGIVLGQLLIEIKKNIRPGINLLTLDQMAYDFIVKNGCKPSFLGFSGYPKTLCISINHELIHAIPHDYVLKDGDMISIDAGCSFKGYHCDSAFTVICGKPEPKKMEIIKVTKEALDNAIQFLKPGINLKDLSSIIEKTIKKYGYYTPREFCGHGIGKNLHEDPYVGNLRSQSPDFILQTGMVLAIEPMVLEGDDKILIKNNNWTIVNKNGLLACHFEHTVLITEEGCEILSKY